MAGKIRRLAWRLGRNIYCRARGEPSVSDVAESGERHVLRSVIKATQDVPKICVLDVGCNIGDWTSDLLAEMPEERRQAEQTRIHCFEPVPETREILAKRLNSYEEKGVVKIYGCALSDKNGSAQMHVTSGASGTNSLYKTGMTRDGIVDIEMMTMNAFFDQNAIHHVHMIKIDAEGHDPAIIRGAAELLKAERIDAVQFEYNHTWVFSRYFLKDIFDVIADLPYCVARIRQDSIEVLDEWHPELDRFFHANYLVVHRRALDWFDAYHGSFDVSNTYA